MQTFELSIKKSGLNPDEGEILIAFLMEAGFESFQEDHDEIKAYISEEGAETKPEKEIARISRHMGHEYIWTVRKLPQRNWNEVWERNFPPISVDNRILVKAPFHETSNLEYTVLIEPKMSFGTGHHETTRLMLREMLRIEISGKEVLDMGCGTGVLGITAKMMGASYVLAVDVDQWAYYNSSENFERNNIEQPFDVYPGDSAALEGHTFHIILANINRNVLLDDMPAYYNALKDNGIIILSGILSADEEIVKNKARECGLTFVSSYCENNWISLNLRK
jgi:ribosomal protein L11 methyltransferase